MKRCALWAAGLMGAAIAVGVAIATYDVIFPAKLTHKDHCSHEGKCCFCDLRSGVIDRELMA